MRSSDNVADRAERSGVTCMQLRGGSSKGAYFLASDLPSDPGIRNDLLLRIMGSPDARQIDGIGGADPLTSKVAIVSPSDHTDADVDYLFLQIQPDGDTVTDAQTCGNLLAGVGPFAVERHMVAATSPTTQIRIRIVNPTEAFATATVQTPGRQVVYVGDTMMAGVPFPAASIQLAFPGGVDLVFPTGSLTDGLAELEVTCVNAGMPVVLVLAADLGISGDESPADLEANTELRLRVEELRLAAGKAMGLGDVAETTVPKVTIISNARHGGSLTTRTFIPHRVHAAIGVLGAVSVAVAAKTLGTVASAAADGPVRIEHPTGTFDVDIELIGEGVDSRLHHSAVVRTARKLADGRVWPRPGRRN